MKTKKDKRGEKSGFGLTLRAMLYALCGLLVAKQGGNQIVKGVVTGAGKIGLSNKNCGLGI